MHFWRSWRDWEKNQDVINLYKNEVINEILWHIVNEGLKNLPSIGKHEYLVNLQGITK